MTIVVSTSNNPCTLASIRTGVQARGYGSDVQGATDTVINDVYSELAADHPWDWLEAQDISINTVSGTSSYSLVTVTDLTTVQAVRLTRGTTEFYELAYVDPQQLEEALHLDRTTGIPCYWTKRDGNILLYPTPNAVYNVKLDYIKDPPPLVADGDSPLFPPTFCPVLVYGALAELAARTRDWAQADRHRARYEQLVKRMKARTGLQQQQTSLQIRRGTRYDIDPAPYGWRP